MEFPEDFNQLELLNTHGHLIPRGASSLWTGSRDEDEEVEEEVEHSEEWYLQKEQSLKDKPKELILWAAENNRFVMEFPEDFNQLELLNTHGHLIPRGASSLWTGSRDEDEEVEEEVEHSEEWYLQKEESLKDEPKELILWAAENNRLSTVHRLVTTDPLLVHCCDEDSYTPLHRAAYSGHVEVVSTLLAAGSKVNPRTIDGWTPLHSACRWSHVAVASFLLHHGAELNAQTNGGLTPLHLAASHTSPSKIDSAHTLELLLSQRHLKPGLRSSSGETASDVARRSGPHYFLFEMVEDCVNVVPSS